MRTLKIIALMSLMAIMGMMAATVQAQCSTPSELNVSNISGTGATVSWSYDTTLMPTGFLLIVTDTATGGSINYYPLGTDRSYTLSGLDERTVYRVELAAQCVGSDTVSVLFTTSCVYGGEVTMGGDGSTLYRNYLPMRHNASYSFSQQIFKAQEVEEIDTITAIRFFRGGSQSASDRLIDIYLDTVAFTYYSATSGYVPQGAAQLHFSDTVHFVQGWVEIPLQTPYVLPAGKNLLMTVYDHTGTNGGSITFSCRSSNQNMSIYGQSATPFNLSAYDSSSYAQELSRNEVVFVTPCLACQPPTIDNTIPDVHSVAIGWSRDGAFAWQVEYRQADSVAYMVAASNITDTHYTVTGLEPATDYVFRVTTTCSAGETSSSRVESTTLCDTYPLPFSEGFENFSMPYNTIDEIEKCWTRKSDAIHPYINNGQLVFRHNNYFVVLPQMGVPVDSLYIELFCVASSYRPWRLEVGVATDPDDTATFTAVKTFSIGMGDSLPHIVFFDGYNGADGHIYIRHVKRGTTTDGHGIRLDSLVVDRIPACRQVTDVRVTHLTPHTATLAIEATGHSGYTLYWGTGVDFATATDSLTTTDSVVTIVGLQSDTRYNVWIRGHCGTELGQAVQLRAIHTLCEVTTVNETTPWYNGFESMTCLGMLSDDPAADWMCVGGDVKEGVKAVAMGNVDVDERATLVLPTFDFSDLSVNAEAVFYHKVCVANSELTEMLYRTDTVGAWTLVTVFDTSELNTWKRSYIELPNSQGAAVYQVAFKARSAEVARVFMLDAFRVRALSSCREAEDVTVRDVTDRSAVVAWHGTSPSYKVQWRPRGQAWWSQRIVDGQDSLLIAPFEMNSYYEVRVIGVCTLEEETYPSETVGFTTELCPEREESDNHGPVTDTVSHVLIPTYANLALTEILIDSAELAGMSTIEGISHTTLSGSGGEQTNMRIYMWHTTDTVLSQFMSAPSDAVVVIGSPTTFIRCMYSAAGTHPIKFTTPFVWDGHSNVVLALQKSNNPVAAHDTASFTAHLDARQKVYYGTKHSGSINMNNPSASFSAVQSSGSNVVPDLTFWACQSVCYEPIVNTLTTTTTSVTVQWYDEGDPVQVEIKESADSVWSENPVLVNGFAYTFDYMSDGTAHDIRLRRVCDAAGGDYSDWVIVHATTDMPCPVPATPAVSDITATAATFAWTADSVSDGPWQLHVWNDDVNIYRDVTSLPVTVEGLRPNETYQASVRGICSTTNRSAWSAPVTFDNICHPVTGVTAATFGDSVIVNWTPGERNQRWVVTYGYAGYERNQRLGYQVVDTNRAVFNGLQAGVTYGFRVVAMCGDDWQAGWAGAEVTATVRGVGIGDVDGSAVSLYPNPASKSVTVAGLMAGSTVEVLDVSGRHVASYQASGTVLTVDVSGYARGTYFVRITDTTGCSVRKLVVR